jgi:hypothetical protein
MSEKQVSLFEKAGFIKELPVDANINDYEILLVTNKDGIKMNLYRLSSERTKIDDTNNFSNSWDVFNSYLS